MQWPWSPSGKIVNKPNYPTLPSHNEVGGEDSQLRSPSHLHTCTNEYFHTPQVHTTHICKYKWPINRQKKSLTSLAIRKMQIKTEPRFYLNPVRMAIKKTSVGEGAGSRKTYYYKLVQPIYICMKVLPKTKEYIWSNYTIDGPLTEETARMSQKYLHIHVYYSTVYKSKNTSIASIKWTEKMCHIHMDFYSDTENKITSFAGKWMELYALLS